MRNICYSKLNIFYKQTFDIKTNTKSNKNFSLKLQFYCQIFMKTNGFFTNTIKVRKLNPYISPIYQSISQSTNQL